MVDDVLSSESEVSAELADEGLGSEESKPVFVHSLSLVKRSSRPRQVSTRLRDFVVDKSCFLFVVLKNIWCLISILDKNT